METTHPVQLMGSLSNRNESLNTNNDKNKKKSKKKKRSGENNNFTSTTLKIIKSLGPIIKKVGKALEDIGPEDNSLSNSNSGSNSKIGSNSETGSNMNGDEFILNRNITSNKFLKGTEFNNEEKNKAIKEWEKYEKLIPQAPEDECEDAPNDACKWLKEEHELLLFSKYISEKEHTKDKLEEISKKAKDMEFLKKGFLEETTYPNPNIKQKAIDEWKKYEELMGYELTCDDVKKVFVDNRAGDPNNNKIKPMEEFCKELTEKNMPMLAKVFHLSSNRDPVTRSNANVLMVNKNNRIILEDTTFKTEDGKPRYEGEELKKAKEEWELFKKMYNNSNSNTDSGSGSGDTFFKITDALTMGLESTAEYLKTHKNSFNKLKSVSKSIGNVLFDGSSPNIKNIAKIASVARGGANKLTKKNRQETKNITPNKLTKKQIGGGALKIKLEMNNAKEANFIKEHLNEIIQNAQNIYDGNDEEDGEQKRLRKIPRFKLSFNSGQFDLGASSNDEKKFIIKEIKNLLVKKSEGLLKKADIRSLTFKKQKGGRIYKKTKKKKGGGEEINMPVNTRNEALSRNKVSVPEEENGREFTECTEKKKKMED